MPMPLSTPSLSFIERLRTQKAHLDEAPGPLAACLWAQIAASKDLSLSYPPCSHSPALGPVAAKGSTSVKRLVNPPQEGGFSW